MKRKCRENKMLIKPYKLHMIDTTFKHLIIVLIRMLLNRLVLRAHFFCCCVFPLSNINLYCFQVIINSLPSMAAERLKKNTNLCSMKYKLHVSSKLEMCYYNIC